MTDTDTVTVAFKPSNEEHRDSLMCQIYSLLTCAQFHHHSSRYGTISFTPCQLVLVVLLVSIFAFVSDHLLPASTYLYLPVAIFHQ